MIRKVLTLITVLVLFQAALADRQLDRTEILQILQNLTSQPKKTWIPSGTIQAHHEEYGAPQTTDANEIDKRIAEEVKAYQDNTNKTELIEELQQMKLGAIPFNVRYKLSNEYTMDSNVLVKFDGSRFYWEINVNSRTDSIGPSADLADNFLTEQFDPNSNQKKVFTWDGQSYTTYFRPVNHAIITETRGQVNGPLTAGVIPWGYGRYSLANLSAADSTAVQTEANGQTQIQLTVTNVDRQETFALDPAKNYALKRCSAHLANGLSVSYIYDNYQLINGNWCPGRIVIERYDTTAVPPRLLAQDVWNFVLINTDTPPPSSFDVAFEPDTFIEDFRFGDEPLKYRYSNPQQPPLSKVDTDKLMMYRLMITQAGDKNIQDCATAALGYAAQQLGTKIPLADLRGMLGFKKSDTSLLQLQQAAEKLGLYSKAIKTDVAALKGLSNYQTILYLPKMRHYVVLGDIDDKYVRLIDLVKNNFYLRWPVDYFVSVWDGTAFLLANEPITLKGGFANLDRVALEKITGACSGGGRLCNTPCSGSGTFPCQEVAGLCDGCSTIYYSRICCGNASSGYCTNVPIIYKEAAPCIEDPKTGDCTDNGDWTNYTMYACE